jgi:hypothetical protein
MRATCSVHVRDLTIFCEDCGLWSFSLYNFPYHSVASFFLYPNIFLGNLFSKLAHFMKMTVFRVLAPCSLVDVCRRFRGSYCLHRLNDWTLIALMMEAVSTSETSINFYQTTIRNIPEDSHLHTSRRINLKCPSVYVHPLECETKIKQQIKLHSKLQVCIFFLVYLFKIWVHILFGGY